MTLSTPPTVSDTDRRAFETPSGTIVGRVDGDVVRVLGVPYAEADRFEEPRPVPRRAEPLLAFDRAPASPQIPSALLTELIEGASAGMRDDEHCQRLSITIPTATVDDGDTTRASVPVMVWIHGGSYVTGAGDLDVYDPRALVTEQDVIVVTVTYRLGVLGFLGDGDDVPANLGLLDQLAAVRWVHENIAAFGGDPDRITLFGQSAGGDAIAHLMISEGAEGLFRRAIVQSAPFGLTAGRSRMNAAMSKAVGSPERTAPIADVLRKQAVAERAARRFGLRGGMAFGTQYGHAPLPDERDRDAAWSRVAPSIDVMIGSTTHETGLFAAFVPALARLFALPVVGRHLRELIVGRTTRLLYTDGARRFARRHRAAGGRATVFEFTWAPRDTVFGAAHVTDVPLLLGTREAWEHTKLVGSSAWSDIDRRGRRVRQIWAEFARTGRVPADAAAGMRDTLVLHRG
ncbi:carboxylesterase family protein [Frigoribacterium sp. 2-23]|uniref:carboxylesterase family protein n=1 Tax=Frigoribacterium sp. 2-23 TaxID=3415006 RepID=UPI003C6FBEEF